MRDNFLDALASRYVMAASLTLATVGVVVALGDDKPWLAVLLLIPLTGSALSAAWGWWRKAQQADKRYERERIEHERTKDDAEHIASDTLSRISLLLRRYGLGNATDAIRQSIRLMNRMRDLEPAWGAPPQVRKFTNSRQHLYATIKLPDQAIAYVREGDSFMLLQQGKDAIRYKVAMLRVHQPPNTTTGAVTLAVDEIYNEETINALLTLAEVEDQIPHGFTIGLPFDTAVFDKHDLASADALLDTMAQNLNEAYLEEVQDG